MPLFLISALILWSYASWTHAAILVIRRGGRKEEGQGLVEYALILVLVAVVTIVILSLLGGGVGRTFERLSCQLTYGSTFVGYVERLDTTTIVDEELTLNMFVINGNLIETSTPSTAGAAIPDAVCIFKTSQFVQDGTAHLNEYAWSNPFDEPDSLPSCTTVTPFTLDDGITCGS